MAYSAFHFKINITGMAGPSEQWSNDWAVIDFEETPGDVDDVVQALHDAYDAWTIWQGDEYTAVAARSTQLLTGIQVEHSWATITGVSTQDILPTQLALRASLNTTAGVNGGPFLAGWSKQASGSDGLVVTTVQQDVVDEVVTLQTAIGLAGWRLGIHRPTLEIVVPAVRVRSGQRFDVIRKRGNDTPENYVIATLV